MKKIIAYISYDQQWIYKNDDLVPHQLEYTSEFDAYDNFAAARLLYQERHNTNIIDLEEYVKLVGTQEFIELLALVNKSRILSSNNDQKTFLIEGTFPGFHSDQAPEIPPLKNSKHYALLITEPEYHESWEQIMEALHFGIYKEADELWTVHLAFKGELPKLENLDGVVITGSSSSAYDQHIDWISKLMSWIQQAYEQKIRMLGICFGHQIIAAALGGEVRKMNIPHLNCGRKILIDEIKYNGVVENLTVYILHGDEVSIPPQGTQICMQADHCRIFAFQNQTLMGMQFHPEFNPLILLYGLQSNAYAENKQLYIDICAESFKQGKDCSLKIKEIAWKFLKEGKLIE